MILNFNNKQYINVEAIEAIRWITPNKNDNGFGIIFIGGQKMTVEAEDFNIIEKAYRWQNDYSIYDKNLKKGELKE